MIDWGRNSEMQYISRVLSQMDQEDKLFQKKKGVFSALDRFILIWSKPLRDLFAEKTWLSQQSEYLPNQNIYLPYL